MEGGAAGHDLRVVRSCLAVLQALGSAAGGAGAEGRGKGGRDGSQSQLLAPERTEKLRGEVLRNAVDAEHLPLFPFLKRGFSV